jgi:hypothetical protein
MVFENEIDLRAHDLSVHGGTSTGSTKIQLEFRVRREGYDGAGYENQTAPSEEDFQYGLDGQAFVPESLPNQDGPSEETSHPQHYQRTAELRAQAAEMEKLRRKPFHLSVEQTVVFGWGGHHPVRCKILPRRRLLTLRSNFLRFLPHLLVDKSTILLEQS